MRVRRGTFRDEDFCFVRKVFFFGLRSIAGHSLMHPTANLSALMHYFTFVRDPLKRCLSHYQQYKRSYSKKGKDLSFEEFLDIDDMRDAQVYQIAGEYDVEKAKEELSRYLFVGLTERFAESMVILRQLSPHRLNLEHRRLHVTRDNTARQEVLDNPAARRLLEQGNQLDRQLYEWVKHELYPALRQKAGVTEADVDEQEFEPRSFPLRYKLTRGYNMAVYRSLAKLRREPDYATRLRQPRRLLRREDLEGAEGHEPRSD